MIGRTALCALALLVSTACQKEQPPPPPAEAPPPVATPVAPPATASAPTAEQSDIPTEEDFEEEAGRELTAANLDAQLDALEKEIQAE